MSDEEKGEISPEELKAQELLKVQELFASLEQGADLEGAEIQEKVNSLLERTEIQEKLNDITHYSTVDYVALSGELIPKPIGLREKLDLEARNRKNERKR